MIAIIVFSRYPFHLKYSLVYENYTNKLPGSLLPFAPVALNAIKVFWLIFFSRTDVRVAKTNFDINLRRSTLAENFEFNFVSKLYLLIDRSLVFFDTLFCNSFTIFAVVAIRFFMFLRSIWANSDGNGFDLPLYDIKRFEWQRFRQRDLTICEWIHIPVHLIGPRSNSIELIEVNAPP